jgi:RNA polymerase sigma-70 factor (ECF subfamily)
MPTRRLVPRLWSDDGVEEGPPGAADDGIAAFEGERPALVGLAYRLLGSRTEAEDVVQDAWLAWAGADRAAVDRPGAWLSRTTSRLALDRLRSARHRRETYVGPWLPEPLLTEPSAASLAGSDPESHAVLADSLTLGFLRVLERLEPVERVVFVLADVYAVPYAEIAPLVGRSVEACRQVASRARRRLHDERPRLDPLEDARPVVGRLLAAVGAGDIDLVTSLLADDVVMLSDGGANHHAARRPVVGPDRVARLLVNLGRRALEGGWVEPAVVNGQGGAVVRHADGTPAFVFEVEVVDGRASRLHAIVNPAKLGHLTDAPIT